jgi:fructokinase
MGCPANTEPNARALPGMITVAGEALIDLISDGTGKLVPLPGGAAFNVARIVARLGVPCNYLGRLATDPYGEELRRELIEAGVRLVTAAPVDAPTTIAIAQLDSGGAAEYQFYTQGTSALAVGPGGVPKALFDDCRALALGGLSIVFDPVRSTLVELVESAPGETIVLLDPNCRPHAIPDLESYRGTVDQLLRYADIAKVSVEDVEVICPGSAPINYATEMITRGVAVVVVTDGPNPVTVVARDGIRSIPVPRVSVVDTIGAGDAIVAGLLSWLAWHPDIEPTTATVEVWQSAAEAALDVAAAVCTAQGATLPEGVIWSRASMAPCASRP